MDDAGWERIERTMAIILARREQDQANMQLWRRQAEEICERTRQHQAKCEALMLKIKASLEISDRPMEAFKTFFPKPNDKQLREEQRLNKIIGYVDRRRVQ